MSSEYWNQWGNIEIDSMHDIGNETDPDCYMEDSKIMEDEDEQIEYNYTSWEAI